MVKVVLVFAAAVAVSFAGVTTSASVGAHSALFGGAQRAAAATTSSSTSNDTPDVAGRYGVPKGTKLVKYSGDLIAKTPGETIANRDVSGRIIIEANDVTIVNTLVHSTLTANGGLITSRSPSYHFTVAHSEIRADKGTPYVSAIIGSNFTATRLDIHNVVDAIDVTGGNVSITSSWLHGNLHFADDPNHTNGSHDDSVQIQSGTNIMISGNWMEDAHNAAIMVTQDSGHVGGLIVQKNVLDNGACTVNVVEGKYGPIQGLTIENNVFGLNSTYAKCSVQLPAKMPATMDANAYTNGKTVSVMLPAA